MVFVYIINFVNAQTANKVELFSETISDDELLISHTITKFLYGLFEMENKESISQMYSQLYDQFLSTKQANYTTMKKNQLKALMLRVTNIYIEMNDRYIELHQGFAIIFVNFMDVFKDEHVDYILVMGVLTLLFVNVVIKVVNSENNDFELEEEIANYNLIISENYETLNENEQIEQFKDKVITIFNTLIGNQQNTINDFNWTTEMSHMVEDMLIFFSKKLTNSNSITSTVLLKRILKDSTLLITRIGKFNGVYETYNGFVDLLEHDVDTNVNRHNIGYYKTILDIDYVSIIEHVNNMSLIRLRPTKILIQSNQIIQIEGGSGTGKSFIVLSCLLWGRRPENFTISGSRRFFDNTVVNPEPKDIKHLFTHVEGVKNIIQQLSIYDNLTLNVNVTTDKEKQMYELLEKFNIAHLDVSDSVSRCSMGERQRIQLIRMILLDRPIWILDEALSNIDEVNAIKCLQLIREVQKDRMKTVFYISHINNLVENVVDTRLILKKNEGDDLELLIESNNE